MGRRKIVDSRYKLDRKKVDSKKERSLFKLLHVKSKKDKDYFRFK